MRQIIQKITHIPQNQWMREWMALVSRASNLSTTDLSADTHIDFRTISQWKSAKRIMAKGICGKSRKTPTFGGEYCIAEIWVIAMWNCQRHSWQANKQSRSSSERSPAAAICNIGQIEILYWPRDTHIHENICTAADFYDILAAVMCM